MSKHKPIRIGNWEFFGRDIDSGRCGFRYVGKIEEEKPKPNHKIKIKDSDEFESVLNDLYEFYVLEDDSKLSKDAQKLKEHYRYVINNLELHDVLTVER